MPLYASQSWIQSIRPGEKAMVFAADSLSAVLPAKSIPVALARKDTQGVTSLSLELIFSGNPGVFELDLQIADSETDGAYIQPVGASITVVVVGLDGKYYARLDAVEVYNCRFARGYMKALANNVTTTLTIKA